MNSGLKPTMAAIYLLTPFVAWVFAGGIKFLINSWKAKEFAWKQIGYGGMPSTHSAIVSSTAAMVALIEGLESSSFLIALTLAFVVMMDAIDLRRKIGQHAERINRLSRSEDLPRLREKMGHRPVEVGAGVVVGVVCAFLLHLLIGQLV